jgi:hypothetical protein
MWAERQERALALAGALHFWGKSIKNAMNLYIMLENTRTIHYNVKKYGYSGQGRPTLKKICK